MFPNPIVQGVYSLRGPVILAHCLLAVWQHKWEMFSSTRAFDVDTRKGLEMLYCVGME
jgi:hypothetical protein